MLGPALQRAFVRNLLEGVKWCHERGVVLRALDPAQIYIDRNGTVKLGTHARAPFRLCCCCGFYFFVGFVCVCVFFFGGGAPSRDPKQPHQPTNQPPQYTHTQTPGRQKGCFDEAVLLPSGSSSGKGGAIGAGAGSGGASKGTKERASEMASGAFLAFICFWLCVCIGWVDWMCVCAYRRKVIALSARPPSEHTP